MARYNDGRSRLFGSRVGETSTSFTERIQQHDGMINQSYRSGRNFENMTRPQTFNLSVRNSIFGPNEHQNSRLIQESSTSTRAFDFGANNSKFNSAFAPRKTFTRDVRNGEQSLSILPQSYDLHQSNSSFSLRGFEPVNKIMALGAGWRGQDVPVHEDDEGFKRPLLTLKPVKGRNSIFSSRLYSENSIYKNGSNNVNTFNITNFSRRGFDTLSDSRFETGNNGIGNQSVADSVVTVATLKNEMVNLLENLHTSILNWAPNLPYGSAIDMEFKKAKQKVENIKEISFAPSIGDIDSVSVSSFSHKNINSNAPNLTSKDTTVGLNTGNNIVGLLSSTNLVKNKNDWKEDQAYYTTIQHLDKVDENDEETESFLKTPRMFTKKISKSQMKKIKTPKATRSESLKDNKAINLKQWYPIAVGGDLAFCGVNDQGTFIKTEAMKKKLKNGQIALINGVVCSLIGSPSHLVVSAFPQKILSRLKNGLTNNWRQLQKDLVSCQTTETDLKRKRSKSPKNVSNTNKASPKKIEKKVGKPRIVREAPAKKIEKKTESPKKMNEATPKSVSPKKAAKASPRKDSNSWCRTRSGRTVKRPGYFWIPPSEMPGTKSPSKTQSPKVTSGKTQKRVQNTVVAELVVSKTPTKIKATQKGASKAQKEEKRTPTKKIIKTFTKTSSKASKNSVQRTQTKQSKSSSKKTPVKKVKGSAGKTPTKSTSGAKGKSKKSIIGVISTPLKKVKRGVASIAKKLSKSPSLTPVKTKDSGKSNKRKSPVKVSTPKKAFKEILDEESKVCSSAEDSKTSTKSQKSTVTRKRGATEDISDSQRMKTRAKQTDIDVESSVDSWETPAKKSKKSKVSSEANKKVVSHAGNQKTSRKETKKTDVKLATISEGSSFIKETTGGNEDFDLDFEYQSEGLDLPDLGNLSGNPLLTRSQLRVVSMETPPLKFFNNNLRLMRSTTPVQSPDWCISQRTETEVKQFQKRRAEDLKKKMKVEETKTIVQKKTKNFGKKGELNKVLNWVAERNIRSPQWHSEVLQYMLPSRKQMEQEEDIEEDEEFEI